MEYSLFCILLVGLVSSTAYAGTEPSPFQPEINQIDAVVNQLDSMEQRPLHILRGICVFQQ